MRWNLLCTGYETGKFNMDFDVKLALKCNDEQAYFRLYRWNPYCISLGANQSESDVNLEKCKAENIEVARRPTGGRAILHAEEITYSVVMPLSWGFSAREIYTRISVALVEGLKKYDERLGAVELENLQPNFAELLKQPSGMLCFASTAKSEVKFKGKKLIGSAQRKMNKTVLQHGSILCGTYHRDLPDYLMDTGNVDELKQEMKDKTTEIETILGEPVDYNRLAKNLVEGFEEIWQTKFDKELDCDLK